MLLKKRFQTIQAAAAETRSQGSHGARTPKRATIMNPHWQKIAVKPESSKQRQEAQAHDARKVQGNSEINSRLQRPARKDPAAANLSAYLENTPQINDPLTLTELCSLSQNQPVSGDLPPPRGDSARAAPENYEDGNLYRQRSRESLESHSLLHPYRSAQPP